MNHDLDTERRNHENWSSRELFLGGLLVILLMVIAVILVNGVSKSPKINIDYINPPIQSSLKSGEKLTIAQGKVESNLTKVADYEVQAVVKSIKKYNDSMGPLVPFDFALAWGSLNSETIDDYIKYSQSGRWYYYYIRDTDVVDLTTVAQNSSNHHLVPVDDEIRNLLSRVRVNDYVHLKGYLVNLSYQDRHYDTSTSRIDTGSGACEIMLVVEVSIN